MPKSDQHQAASCEQGRAWWRYPIMWMVIGGPATVVLAALYTAGIAVKNIDPVLDISTDHAMSASHTPAMKARNHAAETAREPADK